MRTSIALCIVDIKHRNESRFSHRHTSTQQTCVSNDDFDIKRHTIKINKMRSENWMRPIQRLKQYCAPTVRSDQFRSVTLSYTVTNLLNEQIAF